MQATLISLSAAIGVAALVGCTQVSMPEPDEGAAFFAANCTSCHGFSGQGDGPLAGGLTQRPTDITLLARKNGDIFPTAEALAYIYGDPEQAHLAHQPGGALVIEKVVVGWIGIDGRRHAFRPVTTVLGREHGLDPRSQHRVVKDASPAGRSS